MTFEDLQGKWKKHGERKVFLDSQMLLIQVKRNKRDFAAGIFCRDFREIIIGLIVITIFLIVSIQTNDWHSLFVILPTLFVIGFLIVDRITQKKMNIKMGDNLELCIKEAIREVRHQIWLLKNVLWWYLAPLWIGMYAYFIHSGVRRHGWDFWHDQELWIDLVLIALLCIGIYYMNQWAIKSELIPRRKELEDMLESIQSNGAE